MPALTWFVIVLLIAPAGAMAQDQGEAAQPAKFKQEELDQMLAPVALYPDSLLFAREQSLNSRRAGIKIFPVYIYGLS